MTFTKKYKSPLGTLTLASDGESLTGLWFEGQKHFGRTLCFEAEEKDLQIFHNTFRWLDVYFGSGRPSFTPRLKLTGTDFQLKVWDTLQTIPYGKSMTYGEIAKILAQASGLDKMSAQAVGGAVGKNPIAIIVPCHRVLGAGGKLTGYAAGIDTKRRLLELEQCCF